jgi:hypothetical protein
MKRIPFRAINILGREIEVLAYQVKINNRPEFFIKEYEKKWIEIAEWKKQMDEALKKGKDSILWSQ